MQRPIFFVGFLIVLLVAQLAVFVPCVYATQHNFGYETKGANSYGTKLASIKGSVFTCPEDGTADSITVALKWGNDVATVKMKCALYKHSDLSLKGTTDERTITLPSVATWFTFVFSGIPPVLVAGTEYIIVLFHAASATTVYICYAAGVADQSHAQFIDYNGFPDPLDPAHGTFKLSLYCTYTVAGGGPLSFFGSSSLSFTTANSKTIQFNRYGETTLTYTTIGLFSSGGFLNLFGSALLTFTSSASKLFEFYRYGASTLTFMSASEKFVSLLRYGAVSLTFLSEATRSITRTLTFRGSTNLSFLSEQFRTFIFNRYGTTTLSFTVEGVAQGLAKTITFFGSAILNFTIFGEASGLTVIDLISLAICFLALALSIYPLVTGEEKALPFTALVMAVFGLALAVLGLWYALAVAALSFILSMAALATRKD